MLQNPIDLMAFQMRFATEQACHENPLKKTVLDDLPHGSARKWDLHAVCTMHVEHQELQDSVGDGA